MGSGPAKSIMYIEFPEVGIKSGPERPIITRAELAIQSMFHAWGMTRGIRTTVSRDYAGQGSDVCKVTTEHVS